MKNLLVLLALVMLVGIATDLRRKPKPKPRPKPRVVEVVRADSHRSNGVAGSHS